MVKIIIEGDNNAIDKMYLTCKYCGTEFVCHVDDTMLIYKREINTLTEWYTDEIDKCKESLDKTKGHAINCPLCNKMNEYSFDECLAAKREYLSQYVYSNGEKVFL